MTEKCKTALYNLHKRLGAKFVSFAGYQMPVQYEEGIINEHLQTRASAGLFDVSHMGQIIVKSKTGIFDEAVKCLERLMPCDLVNQKLNQQAYSMLTNSNGGVIDDLMITNKGDHFFIVVNAATALKVYNYLKSKTAGFCNIKMLSNRSLLALQGPEAESVLLRYASEITRMHFLESAPLVILDHECWVSRSGYTGEDGFEISVPNQAVEQIAMSLLNETEVKPVGLGARDSLRMEAGLCLYGNELTEEITPVEASISWSIQKNRRIRGSERETFIGSTEILNQIENGTNFRRVGLTPLGKAPLRQGCELYSSSQSKEKIGYISSGGYSPSLKQPISMGFVSTEFRKAGTEIFADLRGKRVAANVRKLPFVKNRYKRK